MPMTPAPTARSSAPPAVPDLRDIVDIFGELALSAGVVVMEIYQGDANARIKADQSPVCDADLAAEEVILAGLAARLPDIPVVSEEAVARGEIPCGGKRFILVDPVDGTKEFLSKNGEFTINLALIEDGVPVAGAVYAPALARLWLGVGGLAWVCDVAPGAPLPPAERRTEIRARSGSAELVALVSRSHPDQTTEEFLARMPIVGRRSAGSSLKFCLLAEGEGDIYPRCGPTMQWDVAAGDAVLRAAGGVVVDALGSPFRYGRGADGFRNGPFIAWADPRLAAKATLR
jgi:3'(2'), 5'-bisphosphate nucleotidase